MAGFFRDRRERLLFISITALGISSIVTQIVLLREFFSVFNGNELVLGIVLGNWVLTTGLGAYLGKHAGKVRKKLELLVASQVLIACLPFLSITLVRGIRAWLFIPGQALDLVQIFTASLLILAPYTLISGFLLTLACSVFTSWSEQERIGRVYFIDNIGDILGGLLFSFVLVFFLNPFQTALVIMIINMTAAILLSGFLGRRLLQASLLMLLGVSALGLLSYDLNMASASLAYPGQDVVLQESSPYGNLVVTESDGQLNFYENGLILFSTENTIHNEEAVHYAMVQQQEPGRVLLISGGAAGTALEILKYGSEVDYVELDPKIMEIGRGFTGNLDEPRIRTHAQDGRLFVREAASSGSEYDVVLIDLPDPGSAQINRFYSHEFFQELKQVLGSRGVVSLSLESSENYLNPETRALNSILLNTLRESFRNVIVIPGDENYFVASDSELSYDIAEMIKERGIETRYVNEDYLSGKLTQERIESLQDALETSSGNGRINQDLLPLAYYYHIMSWMSHFETGLLPLVLGLVAFTVIVLVRIRPVPLAMLTTGFAATGLEVVIIIGFQILYGYVYSSIGLLITAFMAGLALGAYYMNRRLSRKSRASLVRIELLIVGFSVLLPAVVLTLSAVQDLALVAISSQAAFPGMALVLAVLVGMEFPLASRLHLKKGKGEVEHTAGILYSADLFGAFLGAILVSALLIPVLGLVNVCLLIGGLNMVSGLVLWKK